MRFKLGVVIGFAAGYWAGVQADEERRRQVTETVGKLRSNPRVQRVSSSVSRNANRITTAVEDRIVERADEVGAAAAGKASAGTSPTLPGSGTTPSSSTAPQVTGSG